MQNTNIPLDSHIIADTDYVRQYLSDSPELILDDIDEDETDPEIIAKSILDEDDPRFDQIVDAVIARCVDGELHDRLRDAIHESWLWEPLSNMCDDITIDFVRDAIEQEKEAIRDETSAFHALNMLIDSLAEGNELAIETSLKVAQYVTRNSRNSDRMLNLLNKTSKTDQGRLVTISATNPEDE